jgi:hypothetical protein
MAEWLKRDSVTGRVNDMGAKHASINDDFGETVSKKTLPAQRALTFNHRRLLCIAQ